MRRPRLHVRNVHERKIARPATEIGGLIDSLGGPEDRLWPRGLWPRLVLHGPLEEGTPAGHGPIRYVVDRYVPGRTVMFRFTAPRGFRGLHGFELDTSDGAATLRHVLEMDVSRAALLSWPLMYRPLHDALIEDALSLAEGKDLPSSEWPRRVRALRRLAARSRGSADTRR